MSGTRQPLIWCLLGPKTGDNNQILALANALGWPYETRELRFRWHELISNRLFRSRLRGLDSSASAPLLPPWPDLLLTAGRRNEPVAQWLRRQCGGKTRIVHIGRPWGPLAAHDLIISTPQYFLPEDDARVLQLSLPLHQVSHAALQEAARLWAPRLSYLQRPYTAVLIGGDSGKFVFSVKQARTLARQLNQLMQSQGGSLLVTDSARTAPAAYQACLAALTAPLHAYHWQGQAHGENPYLAYLALADNLVVTGESMSMLAEAAATAKPMFIFAMGDAAGAEAAWWLRPDSYRLKPLSHRLSMLLGPRRIRRDVSRIQQALVNSGRARWLDGTAAGNDVAAQTGSDDLQQAVARVRALFPPETSKPLA